MGDITFRVDADTGRAVQGFLALLDKQRATERKFIDMGKAAQEAGTKAGRSARKQVRDTDAVTVATGLLQGALGKVGEMYAFVAAEAERAARNQEKLIEGRKRLVQVSESRADLRSLSSLARSIASTGIVEPGKAQDMVFAARSVGLTKDIGLFTQAGMFMDPESAIMTVGKLQAAFGDEAVGGSRRGLNMVVSAANQADVNVDKMAKAGIVAAQASGRLGSSPEEMMAVLSVLSPAMKSPETAAFRMSRFASILSKPITTSVVSPEAQAARARMEELEEERRGLEKRQVGIDTTGRKARLDLERRELEAGERDEEGRKALRRDDIKRSEELLRIDARERQIAEEMRVLKPQTAATQQAINFRGLGYIGALEKLASLPASVQEEIIGPSMQGREAYSAMMLNIQALRERVNLVTKRTAPTTPEDWQRLTGGRSLGLFHRESQDRMLGEVDPFEQRFQISLLDPDLAVNREHRRSVWARDYEDAARARKRIAAEAQLNRIVAGSRKRGEGGFLQWWHEKVGQFSLETSGDPEVMRQVDVSGTNMDPNAPERRRHTDREVMERFSEAVDKFLDATTKQVEAADKAEQNPNPNAQVEGP